MPQASRRYTLSAVIDRAIVAFVDKKLAGSGSLRLDERSFRIGSVLGRLSAGTGAPTASIIRLTPSAHVRAQTPCRLCRRGCCDLCRQRNQPAVFRLHVGRLCDVRLCAHFADRARLAGGTSCHKRYECQQGHTALHPGSDALQVGCGQCRCHRQRGGIGSEDRPGRSERSGRQSGVGEGRDGRCAGNAEPDRPR